MRNPKGLADPKSWGARVQKEMPLEENGTVDLIELLNDIGKTSEGYCEVWDKLVVRLKGKRDRVIEALAAEGANDTLGFDPSVDQLGASNRDRMLEALEAKGSNDALGFLIEELVRRRKGANGSLKDVGIKMKPFTDRVFEMVWALAQAEDEVEVEMTDDEVKAHIQAIYNEQGSAPATIRRIIEILKESEDVEAIYLADKLASKKRSEDARKLSSRGIDLRPKAEVLADTQIKSGTNAMGLMARRARFEQLAAQTYLEREEARIQLSDKRNFPYPGRRKDLVDANDHHPYITSIYAANYAHQLTAKGVDWIYRPQLFVIDVPSDAGIPQKTIGFEPDFYLPETDQYIVVVKQNRRAGDELGSTAERLRRLAVIREIRSDLEITTVSSEDLALGHETEYHDVRINRSTSREPGENVTTNPGRFRIDSCDCGMCHAAEAAQSAQAV
jgi:hypothetical protein